MGPDPRSWKIPAPVAEGGLVVLLILAAWAVRQTVYVILFTDSIGYLSYAGNILSGVHHAPGISVGRYMYPPLYPHLIAFFTFGNADLFNLVETGRQVSIWAGALTVVPVYGLARKLFGIPAAAASCFMLALTPESLYYSGAVLTESTAALFAALSLWLLWYLTEKEGNTKPGLFLLLGIVLGFAFLTRHAAIGFVGLSVAWIAARRVSIASWAAAAKSSLSTAVPLTLVLTGFMVSIGPQIVYLHSETGSWTLTGNLLSDPTKAWKNAGTDTRFTQQGENFNALSPDGKSFAFETRPKQAGIASSLLSEVFRQPLSYFKAYVKTVMSGLVRDTRSLPYPPVLLVFALAGFIFTAARREYRVLVFLMWIFGGYYFFLALFHNMRDRYMLPVLAILVILAGAGAAFTLQWLARRMEGIAAGTVGWTSGAALLTVILFTALFPAASNLVREANSAYDIAYYRAMHDELAPKVEAGSRMFDRMPHRAFFSGTRRAFVPYDSVERVVRFGRLRGVRYWFVSFDYVPGLRPQFEPLLEDPEQYSHLLRTVAVFGGGKRRSILLEILP